MIEDKTLDAILPVPNREETMAELQADLADDGFAVTNWTPGGVFYTLLALVIQARIDLVRLLRSVLQNGFVSHATGDWLELKAADYAKRRKQPVKAQGYVTISRTAAGEIVRIYAGDVFKTAADDLGNELRFVVVTNTIMAETALSHQVLVEAEATGADYNVSPGRITKSLTHIPGIDAITNATSWLIREGSDLESIESLRTRTLNSWAELAVLPIADKYRNVAEAVPGVLFVRVDDLHPRGQGTVDIIVTSTAGAATPALLAAVEAACQAIAGPYDNLLVKSSDTITQAISVQLWIPAGVALPDTLDDQVTAILADLLQLSSDRQLNALNHSDIIFAIRSGVGICKNVKVLQPSTDIALGNNQVIVLGAVTVTVVRS